MSDTWDLKTLLKANKLFGKLSLTEKLICSCLANCYLEMDSVQLGWLIRDLAKKEVLNESLTDEQVSDLLLKLVIADGDSSNTENIFSDEEVQNIINSIVISK